MATPNKTPDPLQGQLRTMTLMYWALALGQVIFGVVVYVLTSVGALSEPDYKLAIDFQKIMIIAVPLLMAAGYFVFRYLLSKLDKTLSLENKVKRYMTFVLIRGMLFEMAFLFCCVASLVTNVPMFLWVSPVIFLVFLMMRPTPGGIAQDLELTQADSNRLSAK